MVIGSSIIGMESVRKYSSVRMDAYKSESAPLSSFTFQGSMKGLLNRSEQAGGTGIITGSGSSDEDAILKIRIKCINYLISLLFGTKFDEDDYELKEVASGSSRQDFSAGYSILDVSESHYYSEEETTEFNALGRVVTSDGREIDFNIGFNMSRKFEETFEIKRASLGAVMCDPLVINMDTDIASLKDQKIVFDIDGDGVKDKVSVPDSGSGFLALDKNEDGIINDGTELFGTGSGNGFKDLSLYDSDGNGWIDEADEIFDRLKICTFDENGEQTLYKLSEKGVGAICLGNIGTEFSLNDRDTNKTNAAIRRTGIFLYENGTAGTIQHLDLAKELFA